MKIAIATINKKEDSPLSSRAGRAPYFLIFNENKDLLETISNPFAVSGGGAGVAVAKMLADKNVDMLVAGIMGEKMKVVLEERGLKHSEEAGVAIEILKKIIRNIK